MNNIFSGFSLKFGNKKISSNVNHQAFDEISEPSKLMGKSFDVNNQSEVSKDASKLANNGK